MSESEFPRHFNCPNCGSDKRCTQTMYDEQVALGNVQPNYATLRRYSMGFKPAVLAGVAMPAIRVSWDICFECGTEYPCRVDQISVPITAQMVGEQEGQKG